MAESHESFVFTFPKLNGENYETWKNDVRVLLIDRGCWDFIVGIPKAPEVTELKETRNYELRKARAYTSIYQAVDKKYQVLISSTSDGQTAWNILKDNFEPVSRARLAGLVDEFYEMRFDPENETIGLFIKKVTEKALQIKEAKFEILKILKCFN